MIYCAVTDETTINGNKQYTIDSSVDSRLVDEQTLRDILHSSEFKVLNAAIANNNKIVWNRSSALNVEKAYLKYINDTVAYNSYNIYIIYDILENMEKILHSTEISKSTKDLYNKLLKIMKAYYSYVKDVKKKVAGIDIMQAVKISKAISSNKELREALEQQPDGIELMQNIGKHERLLQNMDLNNNQAVKSCQILKYTYLGEYMYANFLVALSKAISGYLGSGTFNLDKLTDTDREMLVEKCSLLLTKDYTDFVKRIEDNKKELIRKSNSYGADLNTMINSLTNSDVNIGSFEDAKNKEKKHILNLMQTYNNTAKSSEIANLISLMVSTAIDVNIDLAVNGGKGAAKTIGSAVGTELKKHITSKRKGFIEKNLPKSTYEVYEAVGRLDDADVAILSHFEYVDIYNKYVERYIKKTIPIDFYASRDISEKKKQKVLKITNSKASTICINCRYLDIITEMFTTKQYTYYTGYDAEWFIGKNYFRVRADYRDKLHIYALVAYKILYTDIKSYLVKTIADLDEIYWYIFEALVLNGRGEAFDRFDHFIDNMNRKGYNIKHPKDSSINLDRITINQTVVSKTE